MLQRVTPPLKDYKTWNIEGILIEDKKMATFPTVQW